MPDILPSDLDAERVLLGALMRDGSTYPRVAGVVEPDDFSTEAHRRIYRAIGELYESGAAIEPFTVATRLRDQHHLESVGGASYLVAIDDGLGAVMGGDQYAARVRDKAVLRKTILACQSMISQCQQSGDSREVLERGEKMLRELGAKTAQDRRLMDAAQIIRECGGMDSFMESTNASVSLPWAGMNDVLAGGFRDGELIIVAAPTGVGKTAVASQIADHAASHGVGTALFSLEMLKREMLMRIAVLRSRVNGSAVRMNRLTREQRHAYQQALMELASMPLWFDDSAASSVSAIHSAVRRKSAERKVGLVIVDYLQLMETIGRFGTRAEAVSSLSRGLKVMATDLGVPVLALSQFNRGADERDEPELSDLKESSSIEQDANTVIFLYRRGERQAAYEDIVPGRMVVKKQRNGPMGRIEVQYHRAYLRFEEEMEYAG